MRRRNEVRKETENAADDITATQEMRGDSRARRELAKTTSKTQFECEMCPFKSGSKNLMERHKKTHQSYVSLLDKETRFSCGQCEFTSRQKHQLEEHMKSMHEKTEYACEQCGFTTGQKRMLEEHIRSVHEKTDYTCEQCDFKSEHKDDVKKRVESKHGSNREEPRIQDEVFENSLGTGIIEARAPSTSKNTAKSGAEDQKKKSSKYILKRINCEICDKKFNRKERFDTHMIKIHKRNPVGMGAAVSNYKSNNEPLPFLLH